MEQLTASHADGRPARVVRVDRDRVAVADGHGTVRTDPERSLVDDPDSGTWSLPVVGDWLTISADDPPAVLALGPRTGSLVRRDPGDPPRPQLLATGVDTVIVTVPSDRPPNVARLERELVTAFDAGAEPVVAITKVDRCPDLAAVTDALAPATRGLGVVTTHVPDADERPSCGTGPTAAPARQVTPSRAARNGVDELRAVLQSGRTAVLIGPSGAGKSTLANAIVGRQVRAVGAVRAGDRKGRHTTASRALVTVPGGGALIDTPGLRALGLWDAEAGLALTFDEITEAAADCRFADCSHRGEPGCAVWAAVEAGTVREDRFARYQALFDELLATEEERAVAERNRRRRADRRRR